MNGKDRKFLQKIKPSKYCLFRVSVCKFDWKQQQQQQPKMEQRALKWRGHSQLNYQFGQTCWFNKSIEARGGSL